jgi:hypothetical protein
MNGGIVRKQKIEAATLLFISPSLLRQVKLVSGPPPPGAVVSGKINIIYQIR